MRRFIPVLALAALAAAPAALSAQATELAVTRQQIQTDRQAIVAQNLPLTGEQATAFWPLYQKYRAEVGKLNDQRQAILFQPGAAQAMTDKGMEDAMTGWFKVDNQYAQLKGKWVKKFAAVLGARGTLRFFQIENRLDLIVAASLASSIPLTPVK